MHLKVTAFVGFVSVIGVACAAAPASEGGSESAIESAASAAEGDPCGDGFFGRPNVRCASGLDCVYPASTAPSGPPGSSSALPGTCQRPAAGEGEACGDGVFGRPKTACGAGLVCVYPKSTAPAGPPGSSSALPGTCRQGAAAGEPCGDGVFGAPNIACADDLECVVPPGPPTGPTGATSARGGTCAPRR